jgi:AraC-like DNA-binding protein
VAQQADAAFVDAFERVRAAYRRACGVTVYAVGPEAAVIAGAPPACGVHGRGACVAMRTNAMNEALSWGEASVGACSEHRLVWAVPLMRNQTVTGALVACVSDKRAFTPGRDGRPLDVRRAADELRSLAETHDLTNAAALELRRREFAYERQRAYAIHSFDGAERRTIRQLYMREEPALFSAIRSGDRPNARAILNRVLVEIYQSARERIELVKSYLLELVVSMCRTAVESGVEAERLLGVSFTRMTELAAIRTEEGLAAWLAGVLEHLMDEVSAARGRESPQRLFDAIAFMQRHCCERLSRDDAARAAHVSGSHFSYLLRRESGATFTELLNRMRTDHAAELLVSTDKPLSLIAMETGFSDQSYFTKVFKRHRTLAPLEFRRRNTARIELPLDARPSRRRAHSASGESRDA